MPRPMTKSGKRKRQPDNELGSTTGRKSPFTPDNKLGSRKASSTNPFEPKKKKKSPARRAY